MHYSLSEGWDHRTHDYEYMSPMMENSRLDISTSDVDQTSNIHTMNIYPDLPSLLGGLVIHNAKIKTVTSHYCQT